MLRNRVNTVPSVRKIELSRENFCSGEPKLINFSTCRSSLEGCGRINQHFLTDTPTDREKCIFIYFYLRRKWSNQALSSQEPSQLPMQ